MDLVDPYILVTAVVAVVLGLLYWFKFRDDGSWDKNTTLKLSAVNYEDLRTKVDVKEKKEKKKDGKPMKIIYYSQTGTAEDFSKRLAEEAETYGFSPDVIDAEQYETGNFSKEPLVVFVVATYGEGDPPDNAAEFHSFMTGNDLEGNDEMKNVKFAVFGLGNRTYDKFNEIATVLDSRMEELGAQRIFKVGMGDDDQNIEADFLVWKKGFSQSVCKVFDLPPPEKRTSIIVKRKQRMVEHRSDEAKVKAINDITKLDRWRDPPADKKIRLIDAKNPILAPIVATRELHSKESERSCLHVEFDTLKFLNYQPGDHLGVFGENDETEVHRLASKIDGGDLNRIISVYNVDDVALRSPIVGPCTLKAALKQYYDISSPARKHLIAILAQHAQDPEERSRLLVLASDDPEEQTEYRKWIVDDLRTPYEVLKEFSSVKVPLDHFLEGLVKMQPRYYSISSSPNAFPGRVHITAVVVDYITPTKRHARGIVTGWLADHRPDPATGINPRIPAFIRRSNFKMPAQLSTSVIMVGPGTGLAPFRGFIQERKFKISQNKDNKPVGKMVFFFGCRDPKKDYLYREELETAVSEGTLTDLVVAFSRTQEKKEYVQHKMLQGEVPKKIWEILKAGGYFYICGEMTTLRSSMGIKAEMCSKERNDAKNMARDVQSSLVEIISAEGNLSKQQAEDFIKKLQSGSAPRYLSDVWS